MFSRKNAVSTRTILSSAASLAASAMLIRTIVNEFLPQDIRDYILSGLYSLPNRLSSQLTIVIEEFNGYSVDKIFEAAEIYLGTKVSPSTRRLRVSKPENEKNFAVTMEKNEEVIDIFEGIEFKWRLVCVRTNSSNFINNRDNNLNSTLQTEARSLELSFHKKHKEKVLASYLPYILYKCKEIKEENKVVKLHTINYSNSNMWSSVNLNHPSTFETLAMDLELKTVLMEDLERFVKRKDFYRRVGKAWKRGYLLYGPPGTGKSSLIAAMANYLNFDIYDLDLTNVNCNLDLRRSLLNTHNRSIIVIEDIDCSIELKDRNVESRSWYGNDSQVTLSGVLNCIDGLWSTCKEERIIIFTTNHKDRLDPALLRPGRMDMHIHMSYCTPSGFSILAYNYLGIRDHKLFGEIEGLIEKAEVTPAEVAGELLKDDDAEIALQDLIKFLKEKKTI